MRYSPDVFRDEYMMSGKAPLTLILFLREKYRIAEFRAKTLKPRNAELRGLIVSIMRILR